MNEFCFVNSPIGVLELEAESNFVSRIKFREGDSLQVCKEIKKVGESPALTEASKQIDEYFNGNRKLFEIPFKLNVPLLQEGIIRSTKSKIW